MLQDELVTVIGAGSWGTALAIKFAEKVKKVKIISNDAALASAINTYHHNIKHIQSIILASNITAVATYETIHLSSLIIIATPSASFIDVITRLKSCDIPASTPIIIACKGLAKDGSKVQLTSDYLSNNLSNKCAIIAGPNFAKEIAEDKPAEANIAMINISDAKRIAAKYSQKNFTLIPLADPIGVQIAGVLKNIIAIKSGMMHAAKSGENAKALLIVQGLKEIGYIAEKIGGTNKSLMQPAVVGDLILTCNSTTSRNTGFGYDLFKRMQEDPVDNKVKHFIEKYPMLVEGLQSARLIKQFLPELFTNDARGQIPITAEMVDLLT